MMKRLTAGLLAAATVLLGVALAAPPAAATDTCDGDTYVTHVVARPDSAISGGTWATDTFDRTTTVTCTEDGYHVTLADVGTFTTVADGKSPQAGTALPGVITGSFTGGTEFDVVSVDGPLNPSAGSDGSYSSSEWIKLVFPQGVAKQGKWSWSYTRHCGEKIAETWTNAPTSTGDITGSPACPTETTPTSTVPTSTSSTPTTGTTAPGGVYYENCDAVRKAGAAPLHRGDAGYRPDLDSDGDGIACEDSTPTGGAGGGIGTTSTPTTRFTDVSNESLASTGAATSPLALLIAAGLLLISGGGFLIVGLRKRANRR